jgi:putative restriction endonuclease
MTREERAQQLWSVLVLAAHNRQVFTYEIVGQSCGLPAPSIGDFLRPIQQYCTENGLPPLTSIIVNKNTGLPGGGFIAAENVPLAQMQTFSRNWLEEQAPSAEQLADAYTRAPERR